eukprot:139700-Rhodomonas_salina.1
MTSERCGQNQYVVSGDARLCRECPTGLVQPSNCPTAHVCPAPRPCRREWTDGDGSSTNRRSV